MKTFKQVLMIGAIACTFGLTTLATTSVYARACSTAHTSSLCKACCGAIQGGYKSNSWSNGSCHCHW